EALVVHEEAVEFELSPRETVDRGLVGQLLPDGVRRRPRVRPAPGDDADRIAGLDQLRGEPLGVRLAPAEVVRWEGVADQKYSHTSFSSLLRSWCGSWPGSARPSGQSRTSHSGNAGSSMSWRRPARRSPPHNDARGGSGSPLLELAAARNS